MCQRVRKCSKETSDVTLCSHYSALRFSSLSISVRVLQPQLFPACLWQAARQSWWATGYQGDFGGIISAICAPPPGGEHGHPERPLHQGAVWIWCMSALPSTCSSPPSFLWRIPGWTLHEAMLLGRVTYPSSSSAFISCLSHGTPFGRSSRSIVIE